jgi:hypothetical protein
MATAKGIRTPYMVFKLIPSHVIHMYIFSKKMFCIFVHELSEAMA